MGYEEKKRGRWKYENLNIVRTKKAFWMKSKAFVIFEASSLVKNKDLLNNSGQKLQIHYSY